MFNSELATYYYDIYLAILTIITLNVYVRYKGYSLMRLESTQPIYDRGTKWNMNALLLVVLFTLFTGMRPVNHVFVDMMNYYRYYNNMVGTTFFFDVDTENYLWDNLFNWWACNDLGFTNYMLLACVMNFGCTALACKRLFPNDQLIAFLVFLGAFSTFTYATNGVKAGTAMAVFVLGLSYYKNWKVFIPIVLASYGMHHSMQLPVAACVLAYYYRNTKMYLYAWLVCLLIAAAHITFFQTLFASITADQLQDKHGASYLDLQGDSNSYMSGFRPDFIIYSAGPVLIGWIAIFKKKIQSEFYSYLLNVYLIVNSIWMLCMYASFTNRIAYLSWGLYPFVLIYPLLKENWGTNQYKFFAKVVMYHLGFTLAMHYIYYVFLH